MSLSVFDIFKIGIGPSSSHTVGPMRAGRNFARHLDERSLLPQVSRIQITLCGSLAETGFGHRTDMGVLLGLMGESPDTVDPATIGERLREVEQHGRMQVWKKHPLRFDLHQDLIWQMAPMPEHPNGMRFIAFDVAGKTLLDERYLSVGGGFIQALDSIETDERVPDNAPQPYPFTSADELLALCEAHGLTIAQLVMENEKAMRPEAEVRAGLLHIARVMNEIIDRGTGQAGALDSHMLPGVLKVRRRAPALFASLMKQEGRAPEGMLAMEWVNLYAMAVNEENAASGRVVTAPTNGAAGLLPAVLRYYQHFVPGANDEGVVDFLLTSAAVAFLFKRNASISGAEVGCQGEVGTACSMAAAGLAAVLGATVRQVENAAEIGMEHNLGLTCDPVGGLVQIPCIERNAMGAIKAINAAHLALRGDGHHHVSLDTVIETMRQTGADMMSTYKETSRGGLAVNVVEC
ncbi:MAG: L-serine ammonia-lyase [Lautropia sp.]|nr:L-serine ammonia-lyase [Lautropia sp.]